ncbi:hypothetical protein H5410_035563 [Solanum commersonii]|uniref:Uncharacterized protein n=1 Tax=Solanum commersonii TaxID=4109 RepID=A0A9J5Y113_SOLCO|nr:hypothetical protein H5410_035563 [Solanum commersonii]
MAKYTTFLAILFCLFLVAATGNKIYLEIMINLLSQKYEWQKGNIVGKKVTSGMSLVNTLTNVVIIANTTMELNMVSVRSTNHGVTNIIGQNMLAIVTHLATTNKLSEPHGLALTITYHEFPIFSYFFFQKYKWQKENTVGKKVTSGMDLVNTLTNVVINASIIMELIMVSVRSTNHGITNITGQTMLATATHLATTKNLPVSHGMALTITYHEFPIFSLLQKYKWQKGNTVGKKVTSGMDLVNTLTNVVIIASTTMELNMVFVRSTNHGVTNITGQNMLAIATHLVTTKNLSVSHGLALTM